MNEMAKLWVLADGLLGGDLLDGTYGLALGDEGLSTLLGRILAAEELVAFVCDEDLEECGLACGVAALGLGARGCTSFLLLNLGGNLNGLGSLLLAARFLGLYLGGDLYRLRLAALFLLGGGLGKSATSDSGDRKGPDHLHLTHHDISMSPDPTSVP